MRSLIQLRTRKCLIDWPICSSAIKRKYDNAKEDGTCCPLCCLKNYFFFFILSQEELSATVRLNTGFSAVESGSIQ